MRSNDRRKTKSPAEIWQTFIQAELKSNSKLGKAFEKATVGGYDSKTLVLYFAEENVVKTAKGLIEPLKRKLPADLRCNNVELGTGNVPIQPVAIETIQPRPNKQAAPGNPLQALNLAEFGDDGKGNELSQPVLQAAVDTERGNQALYDKLKQRTEMLAGEGRTISVVFNWRLRVGGTRGFRELLLPVFHPVFGVPYVPASSLKGATRAWARGEKDTRISELLGVLRGNMAIAAKVEFLDAFPIRPCLSVDVATPQWHWRAGKVVEYKPEPHPLLSMEQPQILIGLRPTSRGTSSDVQVVKEWLENALKTGIGSRTSGGYGKALGQVKSLPCSQSSDFELWTQGMFGSNPPNKQNGWTGSAEFRPTAIRGILRYWFRAFALSIYDAATCQTLEEELFGKLSQQGKLAINVPFNKSSGKDPYLYTGKVCLEFIEKKYLDLVSQLLVLACHLGGVGRGSRRPLHRLNGRMRGCHWVMDGEGLPLDYDKQQWEQFFQNLRNTFQAVRPSFNVYTSSPGSPKPRYQDVLDRNAQIWLVNSPNQIAPAKVKDWQTEGDHSSVRGSALTLLYGDKRFKGENRDREGNRNVGGSLEIPSFVWIKSIFSEEPYQVVTIFGVDHADRLCLAKELDQLRKENQAILVYGQMAATNKPVVKR